MEWTNEQREAIELRNKNILVAAAAGSGKTAVLVERIKRLIIEERCPVDRMLIVTFTNAAAAEMKEKIRKSISEAAKDMAKNSDDVESLMFLKKQLNLLANANISTFHSFSLDVIRRYFYLIRIEPNFKICDNTQEALIRSEAMDIMLDELFEEGNSDFLQFLRCYSGDRNENRFKEIINNSYDTIRSLPEPFAWLRNSVEQLKNGESLRNGPVGKNLFEIAERTVERAVEIHSANVTVGEEVNATNLLTFLDGDRECLEALEAAIECNDYEKLRAAISIFKLPKINAKLFTDCEEIKVRITENRNAIKKQIKALKDIYFTGDFKQLCHEMELTYEPAKYLEKLLIRYDEIYKAKKLEKNLMDFSDIEHYAYEILKDEEAAMFYRQRFEHIFIDEYQDSNVIQEALIDLIKRENNLFMVGDIKQSIYKFRLAEPEIFQNKYRNYQSGAIPNSCKIDLNKNFRSKAPVIDFINEIFIDTMEGYDENACLYKGDQFADVSEDKPALCLIEAYWQNESEMDDELKTMLKAEKEAMAAVALIEEHLGTEIFDSKQGCARPLKKRDIVILMRGVKSYGDIFSKVLAENNIPAYIDDSDGFLNTIEINSFLSALYVIDNPKQDIQLLTLLRSEMLGFSIEELVKIRIAFKENSYYEAFCNYSENGEDDNLQGKCKDALYQIDTWRNLSRIMPLDKLIWKILMETGFYITMGAMPAGGQRQANLRALTDKAIEYGENYGGSLYGFIRYIEAIKEKKVSVGQVKLMGENDDLVRIMTVHKSKGLEFPMVIVAGYCRKLTYKSASKAPVIHKDLGIGFPIVDSQRHWYKTTLLQNMIKDRTHREEVDEEKRILYVALTRAKDKLLLLGMCKDIEADMEKVTSTAAADTSYFSMTGKKLCADMKAVSYIYDDDVLAISKVRKKSTKAITDFVEQCRNIEVSDDIESMMTFEYPYQDALKIRTKYSVSDLNNQGRRPVENLGEPAFVTGEQKIGAMGRGTIYHSVLEHMDNVKAYNEGEHYLTPFLKAMVENEMLTEQEASLVDVKKIADFAKSDLGRRMAESKELCKEKRFNFMTEHDGNRVMVRGIIDCFFEENGELVLIDYKTGNIHGHTVDEEEVREHYKLQIDLYREALKAATGKSVKEAYLYLTDAGKTVKM